ncbi:MAG: DMT family transporter [Actinomycetota bacterium]
MRRPSFELRGQLRGQLWGQLLVAVAAVSCSAPLVRVAEAPSLAIAFWRTAIATLLLLPFLVWRCRSEVLTLNKKQVLGLFGSGVFLAIHFATWIASVEMTTVASSVLLVTTSPVFVAIASMMLGERPSRRVWLGIGLAGVGGVVIAAADLGISAGSLKGDLLALVGAVSVSGYLLMGRGLRQRLSLLTYAVGVYGSCAAVLAVAMLFSRTSFVGYSSPTWLLLVAMALGPQLLGHTTFNFLLGRLESFKVAAATLGEPIGSGLIAAFAFGEVPRLWVFPGALLLLAGVALALGRSTDFVSEK